LFGKWDVLEEAHNKQFQKYEMDLGIIELIV
jgi:hypothetical protein